MYDRRVSGYQSLTALLIQLWLVLDEVLDTLQAIGDQWYRFHGPLRAESLASDGSVLYTIESTCHRITWMQVKTRKQRCLSDVSFQWISLLWCRDLQAELSEQVDGRDSTSTDFSGRGKSRNRNVLAMCFAIHRRSNLLSACPKMLLLQAIACYKNVTTIFSLMPRNPVRTVNHAVRKAQHARKTAFATSSRC